MLTLPIHGRIHCTQCLPNGNVEFDSSKVTQGDWRITTNPLAWGSIRPQVIVLGFSKGPTQAGALANAPHDEIAYKGSRTNVGKILSYIGLLKVSADNSFSESVSAAIADRSGPFHFGSLIRCTVERFDHIEQEWKGSGGGMLDKFVATDFGTMVASNCVKKHLCDLPTSTKLIVMFGMGQKLNYVKAAFDLYKSARGGDWRWLNEVSYTDGKIVVVHVEHFASQGRLVPEWLDMTSERGGWGVMARNSVTLALNSAQVSGVVPTSATAPKGKKHQVSPVSPKATTNLYAMQPESEERFSRAFSFLLKNGTEIFPVRMKNQTTGKLAFRVSKGGAEGNRKENGLEVEAESEMVNYVLKLGYSVRAMSRDKKSSGLYKSEGRSVTEVRIAGRK